MSRKQAVLEGEPPHLQPGTASCRRPFLRGAFLLRSVRAATTETPRHAKHRSRDSPSRAVPQIVSTRLRGPDREFPEHDICVFLFIFPAQGPAYGRSVRGKWSLGEYTEQAFKTSIVRVCVKLRVSDSRLQRQRQGESEKGEGRKAG